MTDIQRILAIFCCVFLFACNERASEFSVYQKGQDLYEKKCITCHNKLNTTTYSPTLLDMHLSDTNFLSRLLLLKADSNHSPYLQNVASKDLESLAFFIDNYKKIVPNNPIK